jgi:hypothetical protein
MYGLPGSQRISNDGIRYHYQESIENGGASDERAVGLGEDAFCAGSTAVAIISHIYFQGPTHEALQS